MSKILFREKGLSHLWPCKLFKGKAVSPRVYITSAEIK